MNFIYWKWTKKEEVLKSRRESLVKIKQDNTINTPDFDTTKNKREECAERISNRRTQKDSGGLRWKNLELQ